ncbi:MAG TPA: hypothetical protein DDW27_04475 [Bacteroidales bacterium]|nr:hypothetical protein [Bacteroidales bacterium]
MKKKLVCGSLIFLGLIASYVVILYILKPEDALRLTIEDGFTENLSLICVLLAACLFCYLFFKSRLPTGEYIFRTKRNYFFLLLVLFCIVVIGEETNWGQRLFDLNAPEWMGERGSNELNLHNLEYLFTIFGIRITTGKIYFAFVILYFMLIPLINKYSTQTQKFLTKIGLPIVPVFIAIFYMVNFVAFRLVVSLNIPQGFNEISFPQTVMEIYEINFTILFLWNSIAFYNISRKESIPASGAVVA